MKPVRTGWPYYERYVDRIYAVVVRLTRDKMMRFDDVRRLAERLSKKLGSGNDRPVTALCSLVGASQYFEVSVYVKNGRLVSDSFFRAEHECSSEGRIYTKLKKCADCERMTTPEKYFCIPCGVKRSASLDMEIAARRPSEKQAIAYLKSSRMKGCSVDPEAVEAKIDQIRLSRMVRVLGSLIANTESKHG